MYHKLNYISYAPEALLIPLLCILISVFKKAYKIALVFTTALLCLLLFYRGISSADYENIKQTPQNHIVSPCEGKVLKITQDSKNIHIAIFLNVHNVHVQYFPIKGTIKSIVHKDGEFHPAYMFEKSKYNERVETTLQTLIGDVRIIQIAGLIARRIVSFGSEGQQVQRGDPLGLIKFGSRVDISVPRYNIAKVLPKEGDNIRIGETLFIFNR
jgi:phosphatidylserine decarboxylase